MKRCVIIEYIIVDYKKYKITEIDGDEVYYRDEYGIEHAISIYQVFERKCNYVQNNKREH